ncbi:MAG: T9SS type A sorting domain-containing protein [Muribaculaceae bacterium]|nr:T9SS type A sorting domain-containing protein [Muribaculaceae bacterium]
MHISTSKHIFAGTCLLFCATASAALTEPQVEWIKLFDGNTSSGDNSTAVLATSADNIYWLNTLGSTDAAPDLFYAGEKIFTGSPYTGTSVANNFCLTKTDGQGNALWTVYSNSGDYMANQGGLASTADGGVVFFAKVRHTDGYIDRALTLVDAEGTSTDFSTAVDKRYYMGIVGKVSSEGTLEWLRTINAATGSEESFIADGLSTSAIATDATGNIYVAGSFSTELGFAKADGSMAEIAPAAGASFYIARLDADGYYLDSACSTGTLKSASLLDITVSGNVLYFEGTATAEDGNTGSFGEAEIKAGELITPFIGALDLTTGNANWLVSLLSEKSGQIGWQNSHLTVDGGTLWVAAQASGRFTDPSDVANTITCGGTLRDGLLFKFDATTGRWLGATAGKADFGSANADPSKDLIGYFHAVKSPADDDAIYVYGYNMTQKNVFIRGYSSATLAPITSQDWPVLVGGGVPAASGFSYLPSEGCAYISARGNAAFTGIGGAVSATPEKWAVFAAGVQLPGNFLSGIENVATTTPDSNTFTVRTGIGSLTMSCDKDFAATIVDLSGRVVASIALSAGESTTVALPAGFYIVSGRKVIVR